MVYAFGTLPILGYFIICVKVLGYSSSIPTNGVGGVLDRTPWNEFFTDTKVNFLFFTNLWRLCAAVVTGRAPYRTKLRFTTQKCLPLHSFLIDGRPVRFVDSEDFLNIKFNDLWIIITLPSTKVWVIAAREVFMTWGMCGAIVMQITSHNRYGHSLRRDITVVIGLTLFVLMLSGFLASACLQIINTRGPYEYIMSSFGMPSPLLSLIFRYKTTFTKCFFLLRCAVLQKRIRATDFSRTCASCGNINSRTFSTGKIKNRRKKEEMFVKFNNDTFGLIALQERGISQQFRDGHRR